MLQHALSYNNPLPYASSFAMSSGSLLGSGMTLQDVQMKEAQAELQFLQCWGEDPVARAEPEPSSKRHSHQEEEEFEDKSSNKWARPESKGGFGRGGRGKGNQTVLFSVPVQLALLFTAPASPHIMLRVSGTVMMTKVRAIVMRSHMMYCKRATSTSTAEHDCRSRSADLAPRVCAVQWAIRGRYSCSCYIHLLVVRTCVHKHVSHRRVRSTWLTAAGVAPVTMASLSGYFSAASERCKDTHNIEYNLLCTKIFCETIRSKPNAIQHTIL